MIVNRLFGDLKSAALESSGYIMVDRIEATIKIFLDFLASEVHMHTMTKINDLSAVENCVCFHLRRATRAVTQFYDAEMRRHGIRPSQVSIFSALNSRDSWSMSDLSDLLGMDRTTLVRNLGPLQRDGFVQTDGGGKGSRVELSLTKKGRKQIEKFMPAWESAQSAAVHVLGEKRWSALLADLDTVVSALKSSETDS